MSVPDPRRAWSVAAWPLLAALLILVPPGVLVLVGETVLEPEPVPAGEGGATGECRPQAPDSGFPIDGQAGSTVSFTPVGEPAIVLALGRDGARSQTEIPLTVVEVRNADGSVSTEPRPGGVTVLDVRTAYLARGDGAELTTSTSGDNLAWVTWRRSTGTATLFVCLDRSQLAREDGGTYTGVLVVDDDRAAELRVPVTATLAYASWWWVAAATWLVACAGLILVFLISERRPNQSDDATNPARHYVKWLFFGGGAALTLLATGAVITTFTTLYLNDPDWGSSWSDMVTLGSAVVAATLGVGGLTAAAAGEKLARREASTGRSTDTPAR